MTIIFDNFYLQKRQTSFSAHYNLLLVWIRGHKEINTNSALPLNSAGIFTLFQLFVLVLHHTAVYLAPDRVACLSELVLKMCCPTMLEMYRTLFIVAVLEGRVEGSWDKPNGTMVHIFSLSRKIFIVLHLFIHTTSRSTNPALEICWST